MTKYILGLLTTFFSVYQVLGCTNLIVTKGASKDGSAYLVYLSDGEWLPHLSITPAADHNINDSLVFTSLSGKKYKVHQVAHTYRRVGILMNEHQLAIGETTFTGREELWDKDLPLKYWELMWLALERAKTARGAIEVMTSLAEQYGYGSEGESFSIADPEEAWLLEMTGTGGKGGAVWVAKKVPDGMITAHANHARIGEFPLNDPENCLYSKNIIRLALEKGYYDLASGEPFRFNDVYDPPTPTHIKYSETRVWSIFRRAAPSQAFSPDYHRSKPGAKPYPLFIEPDEKIGLQEVLSLIRDHYEGTDFDMTKGVAAGPYGNPNRARPMEWEMNENKYSWERPISTPQTAYVYIAQLRDFMPDDLAVAWYSFDDTYTNCFFPLYITSEKIPESFATGDFNKFDRNSMWWAFNFVSNFAKVCYQPMVKDIRKVQHELETGFMHQQDSIEQVALKMPAEQRRKVLTGFSVQCGNTVHEKWVELGNYLVMKYNDGYIRDEQNKVTKLGYPEEWLRIVTNNEGEKYLLESAAEKEKK
jgi:dipeptidase